VQLLPVAPAEVAMMRQRLDAHMCKARRQEVSRGAFSERLDLFYGSLSR